MTGTQGGVGGGRGEGLPWEWLASEAGPCAHAAHARAAGQNLGKAGIFRSSMLPPVVAFLCYFFNVNNSNWFNKSVFLSRYFIENSNLSFFEGVIWRNYGVIWAKTN